MTAINLNRAIRGPVTAVPVVAGKGVRLVADTVNNRFVVEADETVLWEDSTGANDNIALSEAMSNFERIKIVWKDWSSYPCIHVQEFLSTSEYFVIDGIWAGSGNNKLLFWGLAYVPNSSKTVLTTHFARQLTAPGDTQTYGAQNTMILKVVGVNRIASN